MNDHIEDYFNENLPPPERTKFEEELRQNSQLREEVAFYLKTKQVLREQTLAERHAEWQQLPDDEKASSELAAPVRRLDWWQYAAAAVLVLAMGIGWFWLSGTKEVSRPTLAQSVDSYIGQEFETVTMASEPDSLEMAKGYYNENRLDEALAVSQDLLKRNPNHAAALEVAGVAARRQQKYDLAIGYFQRLAAIPDLYINPGSFYEATVYLKRGEASDLKKARELLQKVKSDATASQKQKAQAKEWLDALNEMAE